MSDYLKIGGEESTNQKPPAVSPYLVEYLAVPIEELYFCPYCEVLHTVAFNRECEFGLIGTCGECGEQLFRPFTRTVSEAA
ncbi:MAG: hypothetical protein JO033_04825 [Acidobacteriaceae bacterium]|nr:hypothetical protein [Acidobacteriaceae bacterium]MBV9179855.1 hypothetical protein [Acidobacteriota bacterium]